MKDLLASLRIIANPADDEAFLRVVNVPRRGIGDASLQLLGQHGTRWAQPLLETARNAERIPELRPNVRDAFRGVAVLVDRLRQAAGAADPAMVLEQVLAVTGYEQYLAEEGPEGVEQQVVAVTRYAQYLAEEGPEGVERQEYVDELIAGAAEWAEVQDATADEDEDGGGTALERYLTQAALLTPTDEAAAGPGVTLMTMHMAKGLEWAVVALAGLEDGLFPLARSAGQPGGLEEERRLCYVGLTRARERLYLSWARTRYRGGRLELAEPSRFLEALPPGAVEERSTTPFWDRPERRGRGGRPTPRFRVEEEPVEDVSQDRPRYVKGERVRHRKFGVGVVTAVTGRGRELKVTVAFDDGDVGTKQLLVAYAGLERDWENESA